MAEYSLSTFSLAKAKAGASLGYQADDGEIKIASYVNFDKSILPSPFSGCVSFGTESLTYNFLSDGECLNENGEYLFTLSIISTDITKTTGTRIARVTDSDGTTNAKPAPSFSTTTEAKANTALSSTTTTVTESTEEIFSIATMQPREEIAMHCLEAMIPQYSYPLNFDNTKIKQLVDKAFLFAQEFINQAVLYREKETTSSTVESSEYTSVDSNSLNSDTDKLLYNISSSLNNLIAQNKNQYADQQKKGLNINAAVLGNINAKVSGSITTETEGTTTDTSTTTTSGTDTTS